MDQNSAAVHEHQELLHEVPKVVKKPKEVSDRPKKKITHDNVLEEQYKALMLKQTNLKLKKRKIELEIALLEKKAAKETETFGNSLTTINLSPIVAGRSFLS